MSNTNKKADITKATSQQAIVGSVKESAKAQVIKLGIDAHVWIGSSRVGPIIDNGL